MTDPTEIKRPVAYTRATWTALGAWTQQDFLRPSEMTHRLSPGDGPVAYLDWHYGGVSENNGQGYAVQAAKDLTGQFIRITVPHPPQDDEEIPRFYGILTGETDTPGQEDWTVPGGNQRLIARGLQWILEHTPIDGSYIEDGASAVKISRVLPFNIRTGRGLTPTGNRSDAKVTSTTGSGLTSYVFSGDGAIWTAQDIAEYYLAWFAPDEFGLDLAGLDANLAVFAGYVRPAKNVADGLNAIINPRRGHAWSITVDPDTEVASVTVTTVFDAAITVGAKTINPTADTTTVDPADYKGPENIQITKTADIKYANVVARGSPILLMGTFDFTWGDVPLNLEAGWAAAQETAYEADDTNGRRSEEYDNVFRTFKVTATGLPGGPTMNANGTLNTGVDAEVLPAGKSFLRQLPLAVIDDDTGAPAGYRSPLVVIDVNEAGKWIPVDKLSEYEVPAVSMPVKMVDGWPAFNIGATPNYMLGKNHYTPGATFKFQAIADYEDIYATMAWYSDEIFSVTKATGAGGYAGTLYIDVPEAQCWYRLANTMVDADGAKTVTAAAGELRRDVDLLSGVAAMAAAWYGRNRNAVVLRKDSQCDFTLEPGTFITTITYTPAKTVNTLITQVTHNFDRQTTIVKTDYKELDFSGIGRALNDNPGPGLRGPGGFDGVKGPDGPDGPGDGNLGAGPGAIQSPREARLLSAVHNDAAAGDVVRGDLITGQSSPAAWTRLAKGNADEVLLSDGTDLVWGVPPDFFLDKHFDIQNAVDWTTFDTRDWQDRHIFARAAWAAGAPTENDTWFTANPEIEWYDYFAGAYQNQAVGYPFATLLPNPAGSNTQAILRILGDPDNYVDFYVRMDGGTGNLQWKTENFTAQTQVRLTIIGSRQRGSGDAEQIGELPP